MTDQSIPQALSVQEGLNGYRDDAVAVAYDFEIYFNGEKSREIVAYDMVAGTVTRLKRGDDGRPVITNDEIEIETVHGRVEVKREPK